MALPPWIPTGTDADRPHFIRAQDIRALTGVSKRQAQRWAKQGRFPQPQRLSHKVTVWRGDEVNAWIIAQRGDSVATRTDEKGVARKRPL